LHRSQADCLAAEDIEMMHIRAICLGKIALGGSDGAWSTGHKIQRMPLGERELVVVKDLSELRAEESGELLSQMAADVTEPGAKRV
jgi:hypothetical protein